MSDIKILLETIICRTNAYGNTERIRGSKESDLICFQYKKFIMFFSQAGKKKRKWVNKLA
jgi:hypothetical protein